jgi:hypothetical protein
MGWSESMPGAPKVCHPKVCITARAGNHTARKALGQPRPQAESIARIRSDQLKRSAHPTQGSRPRARGHLPTYGQGGKPLRDPGLRMERGGASGQGGTQVHTSRARSGASGYHRKYPLHAQRRDQPRWDRTTAPEIAA